MVENAGYWLMDFLMILLAVLAAEFIKDYIDGKMGSDGDRVGGATPFYR